MPKKGRFSSIVISFFNWLEDTIESFKEEKTQLRKRISSLEERVSSLEGQKEGEKAKAWQEHRSIDRKQDWIAIIIAGAALLSSVLLGLR